MSLAPRYPCNTISHKVLNLWCMYIVTRCGYWIIVFNFSSMLTLSMRFYVWRKYSMQVMPFHVSYTQCKKQSRATQFSDHVYHFRMTHCPISPCTSKTRCINLLANLFFGRSQSCWRNSQIEIDAFSWIFFFKNKYVVPWI